MKHVVLVEDLAVNRAILGKQLRRLGAEVTDCATGSQALSAMQGSVDLVLCNHDLPDMDGLELAATLRSRGWDKMPIVLISANPGIIHADPNHHLIQGVLQKPIPRAELFSRLMDLGNGMLPRPKAAGSAQAPVRKASGDRRLMRVLAAEDNRTNQLILTKMTKGLNIELRLAANGREAVAAYDEFEPDLIFMDISMPKMDGKQATEEIRRKEIGTGRHVPIVALTAHAMMGDRENILAAGLDHFLTKPLQKKLICEMIQSNCPTEAQPVIVEPAGAV